MEFYEVWVLETSGWRRSDVCNSYEHAKTCAKTLEGDGKHDYRIILAPIMTADHWVEMGEV